MQSFHNVFLSFLHRAGLIRKHKETEVPPRFWGVVYDDFMTRTYVIAPVPLNLVLGFVRWLWFLAVRGVPMAPLDRALQRRAVFDRWPTVERASACGRIFFVSTMGPPWEGEFRKFKFTIKEVE